jgi:hypothetical protein
MHRPLPLVALAALLAAFGLVLAPLAVLAHGGHPVARRLTVVQAVGPYELAVTIEPPADPPGPLFVEVRPELLPGAATLTLSAVPRGAEAGPARPTRLRLAAEGVGPYTAPLSDVDDGDWELLLRADGTGGAGSARLPFTVVPPIRSLAESVRTVAVGVLGGLLLLAIGAVGYASRRGRALPGWLPWAISHGGVVCLAVAAMAGLQQVLSPPADALGGEEVAGRPHVNALLRTEPATPEAGRPVAVALDLVDGATGRPVDDLVPHHEALVHGVVVSEDGGYFAHVHPARVAPGRFRVGVTPDRPGRYVFYAEVARRDGGSQVVARPFLVAGEGVGPPPPMAGPFLGNHEVGDLEVSGSGADTVLRPGEPTTLTFRVAKDGRAVEALQPWLGMAGHLIVRRDDGAVFAHVHAAGPMAPVAPGSAPPRFGPEVRFGYAFPETGSYQVWLQFKVADRVRTLPFRVEVRAEEGVADV